MSRRSVHLTIAHRALVLAATLSPAIAVARQVNFPVGDDPKQNDRKVQKALQKLFKKYPPETKK